MVRAAVAALGALLAGGAQADLKVDGGYIAVPGGVSCPRDCDELTTSSMCKSGGMELGLPCGQSKSVSGIERTAAIAAMGTAQARYDALLAALHIQLNGAVVSLQTSPAAQVSVGSELTQLFYLDNTFQNVITDISKKTDESKASIMQAWDAVPTGKQVTLVFKDECNLVEVRSKSTMGGCFWDSANGLCFNNYTEGGKFDVQPWEQQPNGKQVVPGRGPSRFRVCKCTKMPAFIAVMHSKCAPRCRKDFDPCSQHPGCKRIKKQPADVDGSAAWEKCKMAAYAMEYFPIKGNDATPAGTVQAAFDAWNSNFVEAAWRANRGTPASNTFPTAALCTNGQVGACTTSPIWSDDGGINSEWTATGLVGGRDRYCQYINDTVPEFAADALANVQWKDMRTGSMHPFAPPPLNFLGDLDGRVIPAGTGWSVFWDPPAAFLSGALALQAGRPSGCTMDLKESFDTFYPWQMLRVNSDDSLKATSGCCPPGTHGTTCFVENCTVTPCLLTGAGEDCVVHPEVDQLFEMCECTNDTSAENDECLYFGQPCGVGQVCLDADTSNEPDVQNKQFQCSCTVGGVTTTNIGAPAICPQPLDVKYFAMPAGRGCGECSRVVDMQQCDAAAAALGLPDQTSTEDHIAHRRSRPCGCHYSEHGAVCTGNSGDCLRFNPVYGDGVYSGCDAYEPADAHDFLICACNASLPSYVAEPKGTCRPSCKVINNKQDCRAAAESIGMHLAVHEEQEALLLLGNAGELSKQQYNNYVGTDNATYQHNDDGLGPVVGDGPSLQATRPPGCHYRRRFDADILPDGTTVNWPHLLFNPNMASGVVATTSDMLLCDCSGNPEAPTPAPTHNNALYGAMNGFPQVGLIEGKCVWAGGAEIVDERKAPFVATFQTCIDTCAAALTCRAVEWYSDPQDTVDREGLGNCTHIDHCSVQQRPCPQMDVQAAPGYGCFDGPALTPAPTPAPSFPESHFGGECKSYCCMQSNRQLCCGENASTGAVACPFGPDGGYCAWVGGNTCQRNCYDRGGPCAEIEICFNTTLSNSTQEYVDELSGQIAKDANLLIGGVEGAVVPTKGDYDAGRTLLTVTLRCPDGGCGSRDYIVGVLCFAGVDVPSLGGERTRAAGPDGMCLKEPAGGFTEAMPKAELGGLQPIRVTAVTCTCTPVLKNETMKWNVSLQQWGPQPLDFEMRQVSGGSIVPAFNDQPPVNQMACLPPHFMGLYQYHMQHSVPFGTQFELTCPADCSVCDVFIVHYHDPPCSSATNGHWPALLVNDGWSPSSCAPCLTDGQTQWKMVAYRKQILGGNKVTTPPVETNCLKYFSIFSGPGVFCEANELQDETLCHKAGPPCAWKDGECVADYCPKTPHTPVVPPPPGPAKPPGSQGNPGTCSPIPGLECAERVSDAAIDDALDKLP